MARGGYRNNFNKDRHLQNCTADYKYLYIISSAAQFQIYNILQHTSDSIVIISQNTKSKRYIRQIELLLCLQDFFPLDIVS